VFQALDGPVVITVGNNSQFERFCREVIERPDLADSPDYKTSVLRSAHRPVLVAELNKEIGRRPRALLLQRLARCGIPCGEVLGLHEALTSPRATESGLVSTVPHPQVGSTPVLSPPYRFDGVRMPVRQGPPQLGADTRDVLQSLLNMNDAELAQLQADGVTGKN
jgi:crotonobetainyl-CoA:carnitine CoA-transferase CaiB-like acyl-CoA transferase